jgi:hypothetical protein
LTNDVLLPAKTIIVKTDIPVIKSYNIKVNGYDRVSDDIDDNILKVKYFNVWAHPDLKIADKIEVSVNFDGNPDSVTYLLAEAESTN